MWATCWPSWTYATGFRPRSSLTATGWSNGDVASIHAKASRPLGGLPPATCYVLRAGGAAVVLALAGGGVLERGRGLEPGDGRRGDLDDLTRLRVAALARGTLPGLEGPQARDLDLVAARDGVGDRLDDRLHSTPRIPSGQPGLCRDLVYELLLRHVVLLRGVLCGRPAHPDPTGELGRRRQAAHRPRVLVLEPPAR